MNTKSPYGRTKWWLALPVAFLLFAMTDAVLAFWVPQPQRLPQSFSPAYFQRYVDTLRTRRNLIVILGDSVLWGYKIPQHDSFAAVLARHLPNAYVANLSYEGGSTTNSEMVLRYLLSRGVHPQLVIFNVNSKEMNPADSSYKRLQPAIEQASAAIFQPSDRADLTLLPPRQINDRLSAIVERWWLFYRYRTDIREKIFGTDDLATFLTDTANRITGYTARSEAGHRPTPDRFFATYDMTPLDDSNIAFRRMKRLAAELQQNNVRAIAFISPTNHRLLHEYIDVPEYQDNLQAISRALAQHDIPVVSLDAAVPQRDFIDNDHLTPSGNLLLFHLLDAKIEAALQ